jgi:hypothetical protein
LKNHEKNYEYMATRNEMHRSLTTCSADLYYFKILQAAPVGICA